MKNQRSVIIFGASGMVGKGVLLECLESQQISRVLVIGRSSCGVTSPKLEEIIHKDFTDYSSIKESLTGYDACFFTLGVSVVGLNEEQYTRITHDFTIETARVLKELNPELTFCYVSGQGTDSTEKGRSMWARVKGKTENALLNMGFKRAYMFRPGFIQPKKGVKSKVWWYQAIYDVFGIFYPILKTLAPKAITSTDRVGLSMISILEHDPGKNIIDPSDINELANKIS